MSNPNIHDTLVMAAQQRAINLAKQISSMADRMGPSHSVMPAQSILATLAKHGGMYSLLDSDLMSARIAALAGPNETLSSESAGAVAQKLHVAAATFFYKLLENRNGYQISSALMQYISQPGRGNGITYSEAVQPSLSVPAAFTFVGQFIDHDLTFNGMNLTDDETEAVVKNEASPLIDLDSVYGPRTKGAFIDKIFDEQGRFRLKPVIDDAGVLRGYDLPRADENGRDVECSGAMTKTGTAYIADPRNDENQLILQIHILVQRFHNKLIDSGLLAAKLAGKDKREIVDIVRAEVVATWQSFVLNEYLPAIVNRDVLAFVLDEIHKVQTDVRKPQTRYGALKHKPQVDLVTGENVVRMPHEFGIGFRFGHSQLRPAYKLNTGAPVLLFKDARASAKVIIEDENGKPIQEVDGSDDLRGGRCLHPTHVIDWEVFFPHCGCVGTEQQTKGDPSTQSMRIDSHITARVFNLPASAIPDDIKYVANLVHRNLIRSSHIGVVPGEELASFYGYTPLASADIISSDSRREVEELFMVPIPDPANPSSGTMVNVFRTPLWYYILKEAEIQAGGQHLGELGSRLVGEVLAGAIYYGNQFPYDDNWTSVVFPASNKICLRQIIDFAKPNGSDAPIEALKE